MQGIYQALFARTRDAYRSASNGFHPDRVSKDIAVALDGFDGPLAEIGEAIARVKSGVPGAGTTVRDGLRLIDFQFAALDAAIEGAARADRHKVVRAALLDQAHYAHAAKVQKAADVQLMDAVKKLIGILREDAAAASECRRWCRRERRGHGTGRWRGWRRAACGFRTKSAAGNVVA